MIHEFKNPIPVIVENDKPGYALYVTSGGTFENDIWCVAHEAGGVIRHYTSTQVRLQHNATFDITKGGASLRPLHEIFKHGPNRVPPPVEYTTTATTMSLSTKAVGGWCAALKSIYAMNTSYLPYPFIKDAERIKGRIKRFCEKAASPINETE